MTSVSNLPPGCGIYDLPGNSPEAMRWERKAEQHQKLIDGAKYTIPCAVCEGDGRKVQDCDECYGTGVQSATRDEYNAHYREEVMDLLQDALHAAQSYGLWSDYYRIQHCIKAVEKGDA
jgi:RecJ-like exonuclease